MKYLIDVAENRKAFAEELFKSMNFVKKITSVTANEITNPAILQSIEQYEKGKVKPTPMSLVELKKMLHA